MEEQEEQQQAETQQRGELIVKIISRTITALLRVTFHVMMVLAADKNYFWPVFTFNALFFANWVYTQVRMAVMTETVALSGPRLVPVYMPQQQDNGTMIQGIGVPDDESDKN